MPGGVVTGKHIHGGPDGYWEGTVAVAGTSVPYQGPSVPINAIYTVKKATIATTPTLTFDFANAAANVMTVFATVEQTYRIIWVYPGG